MPFMNKKVIIAETLLILASVLIFRSLWLLLDGISIMHGNSALWVSLVAGLAVAIPSIRYIIRNGRK